MARRDVAKGNCRTDGDASPWIGAFHHAGGIVPNCIQARDRLAVPIEYLRIGIGPIPPVGTEFA
jgi:hypothetical protein